MDNIEKNEFPRMLFEAFAGGVTSRATFVSLFSAWQKRHGMNFDCKGTGTRGRVELSYRNASGVLDGGKVYFHINGRLGRGTKGSASSVFEFRRKVDFALCRDTERRKKEWERT